VSVFDLFELIPAWIRLLLAVAIVGLGATWCLGGYRDYESLTAQQKRTHSGSDPYLMQSAKGRFEGGIVLTLLGTTGLLLSGRSRSEKNGYRSI
jgi:hypothetical protein